MPFPGGLLSYQPYQVASTEIICPAGPASEPEDELPDPLEEDPEPDDDPLDAPDDDPLEEDPEPDDPLDEPDDDPLDEEPVLDDDPLDDPLDEEPELDDDPLDEPDEDPPAPEPDDVEPPETPLDEPDPEEPPSSPDELGELLPHAVIPARLMHVMITHTRTVVTAGMIALSFSRKARAEDFRKKLTTNESVRPFIHVSSTTVCDESALAYFHRSNIVHWSPPCPFR
jgi:hypothetical protein